MRVNTSSGPSSASKQDDRCQPQEQQRAGNLERPSEIGPGMIGQPLTKRCVAIMDHIAARRSVSAATLKRGEPSAAAMYPARAAVSTIRGNGT